MLAKQSTEPLRLQVYCSVFRKTLGFGSEKVSFERSMVCIAAVSFLIPAYLKQPQRCDCWENTPPSPGSTTLFMYAHLPVLMWGFSEVPTACCAKRMFVSSASGLRANKSFLYRHLLFLGHTASGFRLHLLLQYF